MYHPSIHASRSPDRAAIIMADSGATLSYGNLEHRSNQAAHLLRSLGLQRGDCLALFMENHLRFFEICVAAQRCGLYYTTLSTGLSAAEAGYILQDCGAKVLIGSRKTQSVCAALRDSGSAPAHCYSVDDMQPGFFSWDEALARHQASPVEDESAGRELLYSSGTTGRPKGIRFPLPESNLTSASSALDIFRTHYGIDPETIFLLTAPLYHAGPLRTGMHLLRLGATVIVMPRFDALDALHNIAQFGVTHSQWVPTMFARLLQLDEAQRTTHNLSTHRIAMHGAAPCPASIKQRMLDWWGPILVEYYTSTESVGYTLCTSAEWRTHRGSVGRAISGQIHILDDKYDELPAGAEGDVFFEISGSPFEYMGDPSKTASARSPQGWYTTGDIGHLDADGFLYLTDRRAFTIISGGVNVYPQEIEDLLLSHPRIADAAVFGVPNEVFGEEVKAVVQPLDFEAADPALTQELLDYCRANLAPAKVPRSIEFRRALPRLATGKLMKKELRDAYWAGRSTRV